MCFILTSLYCLITVRNIKNTQEDFDLGALQPLALEPGVPYRMDEKPQFASPASRMMPTMAPDENMEKYIGDVSYCRIYMFYIIYKLNFTPKN